MTGTPLFAGSKYRVFGISKVPTGLFAIVLSLLTVKTFPLMLVTAKIFEAVRSSLYITPQKGAAGKELASDTVRLEVVPEL